MLVDICVEFMFKTEKAVKVLGMNGNEEWLPISMIGKPFKANDLQRKDNIIIKVPDWIAKNKELIYYE